jgi:hypothetical protein
VRNAQRVVLEQIQKDSQRFDTDRGVAVGPFARLDANAVAARDGKTRGSINNLFGSQGAFQVAAMAETLNASEWIERVQLPAPEDYPSAEAWFDALLDGQSARGPAHRAKPTAVNDGFLWAMWLSVVPYGIWSAKVARPSLAEYVQWVRRLEESFVRALDHFGRTLRQEVTVNDFAVALASLIEGVWLNQCLSTKHPCDPSEPVATSLRRSGRLLWLGAIEPPSAL